MAASEVLAPNLLRLQKAMSYCTDDRTPGAIIPPVRVPLTYETKAFFSQYRVPKILVDCLEQFSFGTVLTIGSVIFERVNYLPDENLEDINKRCIEDGLLIVGSGLNGDPIVVDFHNDMRTGFIQHDGFWGSELDALARSFMALSPFDIGSFYLASALYNDEDQGTLFPVDAFGLEEQNDLGGWDTDFPLDAH